MGKCQWSCHVREKEVIVSATMRVIFFVGGGEGLGYYAVRVTKFCLIDFVFFFCHCFSMRKICLEVSGLFRLAGRCQPCSPV